VDGGPLSCPFTVRLTASRTLVLVARSRAERASWITAIRALTGETAQWHAGATHAVRDGEPAISVARGAFSIQSTSQHLSKQQGKEEEEEEQQQQQQQAQTAARNASALFNNNGNSSSRGLANALDASGRDDEIPSLAAILNATRVRAAEMVLHDVETGQGMLFHPNNSSNINTFNNIKSNSNNNNSNNMTTSSNKMDGGEDPVISFLREQARGARGGTPDSVHDASAVIRGSQARQRTNELRAAVITAAAAAVASAGLSSQMPGDDDDDRVQEAGGSAPVSLLPSFLPPMPATLEDALRRPNTGAQRPVRDRVEGTIRGVRWDDGDASQRFDAGGSRGSGSDVGESRSGGGGGGGTDDHRDAGVRGAPVFKIDLGSDVAGELDGSDDGRPEHVRIDLSSSIAAANASSFVAKDADAESTHLPPPCRSDGAMIGERSILASMLSDAPGAAAKTPRRAALPTAGFFSNLLGPHKTSDAADNGSRGNRNNVNNVNNNSNNNNINNNIKSSNNSSSNSNNNNLSIVEDISLPPPSREDGPSRVPARGFFSSHIYGGSGSGQQSRSNDQRGGAHPVAQPVTAAGPTAAGPTTAPYRVVPGDFLDYTFDNPETWLHHPKPSGPHGSDPLHTGTSTSWPPPEAAGGSAAAAAANTDTDTPADLAAGAGDRSFVPPHVNDAAVRAMIADPVLLEIESLRNTEAELLAKIARLHDGIPPPLPVEREIRV
jgi:hypothetical protein